MNHTTTEFQINSYKSKIKELKRLMNEFNRSLVFFHDIILIIGVKYMKNKIIVLLIILLPCYVKAKVETIYDMVKTESSEIVKEYNSEHKDSINNNGNKKIYYYTGNEAGNHNNVIFNNYCWQILRTTDTGGVKMIFNGLVVNGKCTDDRLSYYRESIKNSKLYMNANITYSSSYEFDESTGIFTLTGENQTLNWISDEDEILSSYPYTCINASVCTTLYKVKAKTAIYGQASLEVHKGKYFPYNGLEATNFSSQEYGTPNKLAYSYGESKNSNDENYYAFNSFDTLKIGSSTAAPVNKTFGKSVKYINGEYILEDTIYMTTYDSTNLNNHRYTCLSVASTCTKVAYVYTISLNKYEYGTIDQYYNIFYYIELNGPKDIKDTIVNYFWSKGEQTDSIIKENVEEWFENNIDDSNSIIEDVIYCNKKEPNFSENTIWNPQNTSPSDTLNFNTEENLSCSNVNDSYSVQKTSSTNGWSTQPVGLITNAEVELTIKNNTSFLKDSPFWTMTPGKMSASTTNFTLYGTIFDPSSVETTTAKYNTTNTVRPVIALEEGVLIANGNGSQEEPYTIRKARKNRIIINNDDNKGNYTINISDLTSVTEQKQIILKVTSKKAYKINKISIKDNDNNDIDLINDNNSNTYAFTMPNSDVTITINYVKQEIKGEKIYKDFELKTGIEFITEAVRDNNDNIIVAGSKYEDDPALYEDGNLAKKYILEKYDKNHNLIWQKTDRNYSHVISMVIDENNNIYTVALKGYLPVEYGYESECHMYKVYLIKHDSNGNIIYERSIDDTLFSNSASVIGYNNQKIYIATDGGRIRKEKTCDNSFCTFYITSEYNIYVLDLDGYLIKKITYYEEDDELLVSNDSCATMLGATRIDNFAFEKDYYYLSTNLPLGGYAYIQLDYDNNIVEQEGPDKKLNRKFNDISISNDKKHLYLGGSQYYNIEFDNTEEQIEFLQKIYGDEYERYMNKTEFSFPTIIDKKNNKEYHLETNPISKIMSVRYQDDGIYLFINTYVTGIEGINNEVKGTYLVRLDNNFIIKDKIKISDNNIFSNNDKDSCVFSYEDNTLSRYCVKNVQSYDEEITIYIEDGKLDIESVFAEIPTDLPWKIIDNSILKIKDNQIIPLKVGETLINVLYNDNSYSLKINIKDHTEDTTDNSIIRKNPETKDYIRIVFSLMLISIIYIKIIINKRKTIKK